MNSPVWPSANLKLLLLLKKSNESYFQTVEILLPPLCPGLFYQAPLQLAQKSSGSSSQLSAPPNVLSRNLQEASALVHQQCLHTKIVFTSFSPPVTKCPVDDEDYPTRLSHPSISDSAFAAGTAHTLFKLQAEELLPLEPHSSLTHKTFPPALSPAARLFHFLSSSRKLTTANLDSSRKRKSYTNSAGGYAGYSIL